MNGAGPLLGADPVAELLTALAISPPPAFELEREIELLVAGLSLRLAGSSKAVGDPATWAAAFVAQLTCMGFPFADWESGEVHVFPSLVGEKLAEIALGSELAEIALKAQ